MVIPKATTNIYGEHFAYAIPMAWNNIRIHNESNEFLLPCSRIKYKHTCVAGSSWVVTKMNLCAVSICSQGAYHIKLDY